MAVTSARSIVTLKEAHFERDNARIDKYTLGDELPAQLADLNLRPRAMAQPSYSLCRVTPDDKDLVLKFLRRFFFRDEPMNLAVNLLETPESRCEELENYAAATLEDLVSVAAVDENGDFVGIVVNGIARREVTLLSFQHVPVHLVTLDRGLWIEEVDYSDKSAECPNPKFRRILQVLGHLDREARIWEKLPEDCHSVLEVRIASTHPGWRGRGLMRVLCEESERIAKAIGAGAMRMDTTSAFSAAAGERLGYKSVYSTLYSDLPFAPQPEAPHLEARVYIKELS